MDSCGSADLGWARLRSSIRSVLARNLLGPERSSAVPDQAMPVFASFAIKALDVLVVTVIFTILT
jgi:hypothetical protein